MPFIGGSLTGVFLALAMLFVYWVWHRTAAKALFVRIILVSLACFFAIITYSVANIIMKAVIVELAKSQLDTDSAVYFQNNDRVRNDKDIAKQGTLYTRINVANSLSIEIPSHWHVAGSDERMNIAATVEAVMEKTTHIASLAVSSRPLPVGSIIRVSFIETLDFSQSDITNLISENRSEFLKVTAEEFKSELSILVDGLRKFGGNLVGGPSFDVGRVSSMNAVIISYKRSNASGSIFNVYQYHILMGLKKSIITISYVDSGSVIYRPIINKIFNSISFNK